MMKRSVLMTFWALFLSMSATLFAQSVALTPVDRKDDWWSKRHAANVERMNQGDIDLLMIGDSITHGWEGAGKNYWDMYYGHRKAINMGFSGDRTEHVLWRLENLPLEKIAPKLAVIMIGTNNIGHDSSTPREAADGIKAIVNRLQKAYPEMKILVLHVFPRNDGAPEKQYGKKVEEINSYLPETLKGEKNVTLLDLNPKFLTAEGVLTKEMMPDLLHPQQLGYGIWARSVDPVIASFLGEVNPATSPGNRMGDKWWKDRFFGNYDQIDSGNACDLLMIGDSITHGWDGQRDLWNKSFGEFNPINMGFSGDRTEHVLWRLDNLPLEKIAAKKAAIMIGTNNTGNPRNTPYQIAQGIKAIVDRLQTQYPEMQVYVLNVFPRSEKPEDMGRLKVNEINACLPGLLEGMKNVQIVDFNAKFLDADGILPKAIMNDFLHPGAEGYKIWADELGPILKK